MRYEIVIPQSTASTLKEHLLKDRNHEQMAILLCGTHRNEDKIRMLARHVLLMPPDAFAHQSAGGLRLKPEVQRHVFRMAAREGLSQVDCHTHPPKTGCSEVSFSSTDDGSEQEVAVYISRKIPNTVYASVVMTDNAIAARVWEVSGGTPRAVQIEPPKLGIAMNDTSSKHVVVSVPEKRFDRQVRAFGAELQARIGLLKVGQVGCGGIGSVVVEQLARLGVRNWVLVDPDVIDTTNLNRLANSTLKDVDRELAKVEVAARAIRSVDPQAQIRTFRNTVYAPQVLKELKRCDLLIAATDDHASRLVLNSLACQYLIPLAHIGVSLESDSGGKFKDISGEAAICEPGGWCLSCAGIVNAQQAGWDLASPEERGRLQDRGYLSGVPAPAVYHLNAIAASLGVTEIHNLICTYKARRNYVVYRELEGDLLNVKVEQDENCNYCSPSGILGLGDLAPVWRPQR